MESNKKSLAPPTNNQIWVPAISQKERKELSRRHKNKTADINTNTHIWLSPSSQKDQSRATLPHIKPIRTSSNARKLFRPVIDTRLRLGFNDKTFWDWLPHLLQLLAVLAIAGSIFLNFSRFTSREIQQQDGLAQQTFQEQVRLAQQQSLEQKHLVAQIVHQQQLLVQQESSLANLEKHEQAHLTQQQSLGQKHLVAQIVHQQQLLVQQESKLADQGHEQLLITYLNSIADILPALKQSDAASPTRLLAQTKTLAIFNAFKLDPIRAAIVLQFLHDSGLISIPSGNSKEPIISLINATFGSMSLKQANLSSTSFDGVTLTGTDLSQATLTSSSFRGATLTKDIFAGANLGNVDFSGANLENADFTGATLKGANLSGADTKNAKLKGIIW